MYGIVLKVLYAVSAAQLLCIALFSGTPSQQQFTQPGECDPFNDLFICEADKIC